MSHFSLRFPTSTCQRPSVSRGQTVPSRIALKTKPTFVTKSVEGSNNVDALIAKRGIVLGLGLFLSSTLRTGLNSASADECALQTAASGLQFCDTVEGNGDSPVRGAIIRCHYTGRLASNNKVFDSSYERGRPLSFKIGVREVIAGWDEGILGGEGIPPMKEGGKRRLVIPSEMAYGERGAGRGVIPPNATLIFDVELLGRR